MTIVLDSNVIIYTLSGQLAQPLPAGPYAISVITKMELLAYPDLTVSEEQRITQFVGRVVVVDLTPQVQAIAIQLRRRHRVKLPDAIVAATAISLGVELLTSDIRLARLPGLRSQIISIRV